MLLFATVIRLVK